MERAYKRKCFQGRGAVARWMDRGFFSCLCGAALYVIGGKPVPALLLVGAALLLFILWDVRRWRRFQQELWRRTADQLRRENWMKGKAETIRAEGGTILYPAPDKDTLIGLCLGKGQGSSFHCFGAPREDLIAQAAALGCSMAFHPWEEGAEASRDQVMDRIERDVPQRKAKLWTHIKALPGNRYLLTGCLLLLLSIFLRRALYWRLMGSLCLLIGAMRRSFHFVSQT